MKHSKLGLGLVVIFLIITLVPSLYAELTYGGKQWMWGFIIGGMPLSTYGVSIGWFASTPGMIILSWTLIFGSYLLNLSILYFIGYWIEKLYKKYHT